MKDLHYHKEAVSKVLAAGKFQSRSKQTLLSKFFQWCYWICCCAIHVHLASLACFMLFSGLTKCTINFAPQQLDINVGGGASHQQDEEFDALVAELPPSSDYWWNFWLYLRVYSCEHTAHLWCDCVHCNALFYHLVYGFHWCLHVVWQQFCSVVVSCSCMTTGQYVIVARLNWGAWDAWWNAPN